MASSSPIRDAYVDLLLDRVRDESYPNPEHLDRIEKTVRSPEQLVEYINILFGKVDGVRYPNPAILDRIERIAAMVRER